jgi:hypothetical protein
MVQELACRFQVEAIFSLGCCSFHVGFVCVLCALKDFVDVHLDLFRTDPECEAC